MNIFLNTGIQSIWTLEYANRLAAKGEECILFIQSDVNYSDSDDFIDSIAEYRKRTITVSLLLLTEHHSFHLSDQVYTPERLAKLLRVFIENKGQLLPVRIIEEFNPDVVISDSLQ